MIVHHTRKQQANDSLDMISGTNGLLGAADGAMVMQKEKRTGNKATLDVVGREIADQKIYLLRDEKRLIWNFDHAETELWKEPPDPLLEKVAALLTDRMEWSGTATELVYALGTDMKANALAMQLNVRAERLLNEHNIHYENVRSHAGRNIRLTMVSPKA